jgi:hypothetical protein
VIGLMPRYVPKPPRKRLPFSRSRKRRLPASSGIFWEGTTEFPIATVRPKNNGHMQYAIGALTRWLVARWQWFKPRWLPVAVAALSMFAVVSAADYLAHHMGQKAPPKAVHVHMSAR